MAQIITVKLHLGKEIRRFKSDKSDLTWSALKTRAADVFNLPAPNTLKVTYVDDEQDVITISTNDELQEAIGLALTCEPPVLRLTVPNGIATVATETEKFNDKAAPEPPASTPRLPVPPELAPFFDSLVKQLPAAMALLPEELKKMIPLAELDLAATIAANAGAGRVTDRFCPTEPHRAGAKEGVHEGVTCDKSGMCPIVGPRYHLVGHNYDLCQAEFDKLNDKEKALFRKVLPPLAAAAGNAVTNGTNGTNDTNGIGNVHPGVECDRSGMCPIVGMRYNLRGHNYDLCQAEFDKLPAAEKLLYEALPPPNLPGSWRPAQAWGWRGGHGCGMGRAGKGGEPKLAARFVRDVTIFDGTQMAPGTNFTKIWRLKNVGEVPWPPGTRILFVGGDQMTTEMSVPLSRTSAVLPGEEVDVAVEMTAPKEHGRYLGYWRLTGPFMRRKFGQRVWCHVQVVDPSQSGAEAFDDLQGVLAEIERKKSDLTDGEAGEAADDEPEGERADEAASEKTEVPVKVEAAAMNEKETAAPPAAAIAAEVVAVGAPVPEAAAAGNEEAAASDGNSSDDGFVVTDGEPIKSAGPPADGKANGKAPMDKAVVDPGPSSVSVSGRDKLLSMGFQDTTMIDMVLAKHGDDVEACARDLAAASEWDSLLDDLSEMGFTNRELNMSLMLKNGGNIKRTVRDLVEA